jgi:hypothetical protein
MEKKPFEDNSYARVMYTSYDLSIYSKTYSSELPSKSDASCTSFSSEAANAMALKA